MPGASLTFANVTLRRMAWATAGATFAVNVTTRGSAPVVPPATVATATPPKVTVAAETPTWPAAEPWWRIASRSSASPLARIVTVSVAPATSVRSGSVTTPEGAVTVGAAFST